MKDISAFFRKRNDNFPNGNLSGNIEISLKTLKCYMRQIIYKTKEEMFAFNTLNCRRFYQTYPAIIILRKINGRHFSFQCIDLSNNH